MLNCGTGSFLRQLSGGSKYKDFTLVGFDTMPQIWPEICPSNVSFVVHHILTRHPLDRHESFDSVHTSFLGPVLVAGDWDRAFNNMMDLVKPGGWIQYVEPQLHSVGEERHACMGLVNDVFRLGRRSGSLVNVRLLLLTGCLQVDRCQSFESR